MKLLKRLSLAFVFAILCLAFSSCDSNDEDSVVSGASKKFVGFWQSEDSPYILILDKDGSCLCDNKIGKWLYNSETGVLSASIKDGDSYLWNVATSNNGVWTGTDAKGAVRSYTRMTKHELAAGTKESTFFHKRIFEDANGNQLSEMLKQYVPQDKLEYGYKVGSYYIEWKQKNYYYYECSHDLDIYISGDHELITENNFELSYTIEDHCYSNHGKNTVEFGTVSIMNANSLKNMVFKFSGNNSEYHIKTSLFY